MKNFGQSLRDRLEFVLSGRKIHPWGKGIGLSRGTVENIDKKGGMPSTDTLTAIRRSENVRLEWLLEGRGMPYSVTVCSTDQDAAALLAELTEPEKWDVTLVSDGISIVAVLSQPSMLLVKDTPIVFTLIEVVTGAIGAHALGTLRMRWIERQGIDSLSYKLVTTEVMTSIEHGEVGTYQLFHAPDAILNGREPINEDHAVLTSFAGASEKEETTLLNLYRAMKPEDRKTALRVAEGLVDYKVDGKK